MPNFSLGNYFACSLQMQGIAVGGYDYYGMMYEGQFLQLPKGLKNGKYILEIEVVNTWRNRLIGDRDKNQNERFTKTNITVKPDWQLLPSGLLGPVRLLELSK